MVYYYVSAEKRVYWREVAIPAGNDAVNAALPISQFNGGGGVQPLASYLNSGKILSEFVTGFQPTLQSSRLTVLLESEGSDPGKAGNGKLQLTAVAYLRN